MSNYYYEDTFGDINGPLSGPNFAKLINQGVIEKQTQCRKEDGPLKPCIELVGAEKWSELAGVDLANDRTASIATATPPQIQQPVDHQVYVPPRQKSADEVEHLIDYRTPKPGRKPRTFELILSIVFCLVGFASFSSSASADMASKSAIHDLYSAIQGLTAVVSFFAGFFFFGRYSDSLHFD